MCSSAFPAVLSHNWNRCFFSILSCPICSHLTHLEEPCSHVICINANQAVCNLNKRKKPLENWEGNWQLLFKIDFWIWVVLLVLCFFWERRLLDFFRTTHSASVIKQQQLLDGLKTDNYSSFWMIVSLRLHFWEYSFEIN